MVHAFEGNQAETTTMLPAIEAFTEAHQLTGVTVVADAGMMSAANQEAIEDAGLSFILGARIPDVPFVVARRRCEHPGQQIPDGHVFTQPWPAGPASSRRDQVLSCQYKAGRAGRTHMIQPHPGDQPGEARPRIGPGSGMPQVLIDHQHP